MCIYIYICRDMCVCVYVCVYIYIYIYYSECAQKYKIAIVSILHLI